MATTALPVKHGLFSTKQTVLTWSGNFLLQPLITKKKNKATALEKLFELIEKSFFKARLNSFKIDF